MHINIQFSPCSLTDSELSSQVGFLIIAESVCFFADFRVHSSTLRVVGCPSRLTRAAYSEGKTPTPSPKQHLYPNFTRSIKEYCSKLYSEHFSWKRCLSKAESLWKAQAQPSWGQVYTASTAMLSVEDSAVFFGAAAASCVGWLVLLPSGRTSPGENVPFINQHKLGASERQYWHMSSLTITYTCSIVRKARFQKLRWQLWFPFTNNGIRNVKPAGIEMDFCNFFIPAPKV